MREASKTVINVEEKTIHINIVLTAEELDDIFNRFIELTIEGGSFSWGFNPGNSINHVVIFKKVKKVDDATYIDDHSVYPFYKILLEILAVLFFPLMGLYFLISMFISILT